MSDSIDSVQSQNPEQLNSSEVQQPLPSLSKQADNEVSTVNEEHRRNSSEIQLLSSRDDPYEGDTDAIKDSNSGSPSPPDSPRPPIKGQRFTLSGTKSDIYISDTNKTLSASGSSKIVVLLTNSLGLGSENNLRLADLYSDKLQCPVLVPDIFSKDPITTSGAEVPENELVTEQTVSLSLENVKSWAIGAIKGFMDEMWLARHTFEHTYPLITNILAEIVQIYKPMSLVVIGYAFGARYVFRLLEDRNNDAWLSEEDLISAGVAISPSLATIDDLEVVSKPIFVVHAENDNLFDQAVLDKAAISWKHNNIDYSVLNCTEISDNIVKSLPHGFAVPGDYSTSIVGDWPKKVVNQAVEWLQDQLD